MIVNVRVRLHVCLCLICLVMAVHNCQVSLHWYALQWKTKLELYALLSLTTLVT